MAAATFPERRRAGRPEPANPAGEALPGARGSRRLSQLEFSRGLGKREEAGIVITRELPKKEGGAERTAFAPKIAARPPTLPPGVERAMSYTLWIIAGETSGDMYGAELARELRKVRPETRIQGMGGIAMRRAGVEILVDSTELGVVGLFEVFRRLPLFRRIFYDLLNRAAATRPDAVILIDYPGFNLRFAERLYRLGIPVVYFISPQVWAWGRRRIGKIVRIVDKMLVIFPFEPRVYAGTPLDVEFVGHPLVSILERNRDPAAPRRRDTVVLLPGSRASEVGRLFPAMLDTARLLVQRRPELKFVAPLPREAIAEQARSLYAQRNRGRDVPDIQFEVGTTWKWLQQGAAGLAACGTVAVEAAILGLPLVVLYRMNPFTFLLARRLVRIPYITMVNLVLQRLVFEEFIQHQVKAPLLADALDSILPDGERRAEVEQGMEDFVRALGRTENASARAAQSIFRMLDARRPDSRRAQDLTRDISSHANRNRPSPPKDQRPQSKENAP